jgi:hypothetical protein
MNFNSRNQLNHFESALRWGRRGKKHHTEESIESVESVGGETFTINREEIS